MEYLKKIKEYVKNHKETIALSASLGIGAIGMYLTNTPDVVMHWSDYVGSMYVSNGAGFYIQPKDPQLIRVFVSNISTFLTFTSMPLLLGKYLEKK